MQYFFTLPDTDYKPTGSRDPLGLQVIWQAAGSQVIPFLSTVSANLRDFKILCLAHAHFGDDLTKAKFIKIEQLCAYTRHYKNKSERFNGIEKVKSKFNQEVIFPIKIISADALLANQIVYGIWGKYNRPFVSMNLKEKLLQFTSLNALNNKEKRLLNKCKKDNFMLYEDDIKEIGFLDFKPADKSFFINNILNLHQIAEQKKACEHQNELYQIYQNYPDLVPNFKQDDFFMVLNRIQEQATSSLSAALETIKQTERIITPLNRIFRHLQTKPMWRKNQGLEDLQDYIDKIEVSDFIFKNEATAKLQQILATKDVWKIAEGLVQVNTTVSKNRNKNAWLYLEGDKLIFNEKNGEVKISYWDNKADNDFYYFINTYTGLYQETQKIA